MPKLKPTHISVTDAEDAAITAAAMTDPDALPFTDEQWASVKPRPRSLFTRQAAEKYGWRPILLQYV